MKLSDLVNENTQEVELDDVLFEESELNEEMYKGRRYDPTSFKADIDKFYSKAGSSKGNPFKELLTKYKSPFGTRDIAAETKGLPGASDILSYASDYRQLEKGVNDLAAKYNDWMTQYKDKVRKTSGDDKSHKTMPKEVKSKLNEFYKQYSHYAKLAPKAHAKALKFGPKLSEAKNKVQVKGNVAQQKSNVSTARKESVDKFKSGVRSKVNSVGAGTVKFGSAWKQGVKGLIGKKSTNESVIFNSDWKNKAKSRVKSTFIYEANLEKCAEKGCKNTVKGYEDEDYATDWTVDLNTKKGYCEEHGSSAGKNTMEIPIRGSMGPKDDIAKLVDAKLGKNKK